MSIGIGVGISLTSRARAAFTPLTVPGCDVWCQDDDSGVSPASGAPTSIPNKGLLGGTMNSVNAAGDSTLNSRRAKLFDGSNDYYASSLASSNFVRYHDGSASTIVAVVNLGANATQLICGTYDGNANLIGFLLNYNGGANRRFVFRVANGTGTTVLTLPLTTGQIAESTTGIVSARWEEGAAGADLDVRVNGVSVGTAEFTGVSPSASNPNYTLRWGGASNSIQGYSPEFALYRSYLSEEDLSSVEEFMADRWGVAL